MNIIGIDLGTSTSEVAVLIDGEVRVLNNIGDDGSTKVPSVVMIEENDVCVGISAKNQAILKPDNTFIEIKKYMGTDYKKIIDGQEYSPEIISSFILKKLKDIAEFYLGEEVKEAVITVPANFNEKQRKSTKKAGEIAGLNVERIINEPTSAAIAYGFNNNKENENILVYDFGGGTIDITILELYNGVLDVKASRGGNIGGKDIDECISRYLVEQFESTNGIKLNLNNKRILSMIKNISEECKISLSFNDEYEAIIPYICKNEEGKSIDLDIVITRQMLEELISPIIEDTLKILSEVLGASEVNKNDITKVILTGGSTRIPYIHKVMSEMFGTDKMVEGINPDEIVATGAAIQGAIKSKTLNDSNIVVVDACSYTLGVEVIGNKLNPIIKRDSKLPAKVTRTYKTVEKNQSEAVINIYQGEFEDIKKDIYLDTIVIDDIPEGDKGEQTIDITFCYDLNGMLNVDIGVVSSGKSVNKIINRKESSQKSLEEKSQFILQKTNQEVVKYSTDDENVNTSYDSTQTENDDEDEDYSTIYAEVAALTKYLNENLKNFEYDIQKEVNQNVQDLLKYLKIDDFKECRKIEHKILELLGIE